MVRNEIRYSKEEDPNEDQIGLKVGFYARKSKIGIPHRTGEFELMITEARGFKPGDTTYSEYCPFMLNAGLISKSGSWYATTGSQPERIGQGEHAVAEWIKEMTDEERMQIRRQCTRGSEVSTGVDFASEEPGPGGEDG